jgi:hypothetical protein
MLKDLKKDESGWYVDPDGTSWEYRADYLYSGVLPSCGCGDPASIGRYVKDMLTKFVPRPGEPKNLDYWNKVSYEDLPTMFFLSWADHEGFIEHGTTIRCSWLTERGIQLLADIEEIERETKAEEERENDGKER